ncbi:hypothetical protein IGO_01069 [Bacillus toyonensis]|nr:hypothetical protein IGO_01069 [Bacillus toyonensis]MDP9744691.1 uncharacterized protein YjcR [Bacillus thuringiensis]
MSVWKVKIQAQNTTKILRKLYYFDIPVKELSKEYGVSEVTIYK